MAETMVDSTLANYKAGKLGFSELILARRTWLDLKKEEVSLKQSLLNARLVCLTSCETETL
jgi:outer membrane protein TolC